MNLSLQTPQSIIWTPLYYKQFSWSQRNIHVNNTDAHLSPLWCLFEGGLTVIINKFLLTNPNINEPLFSNSTISRLSETVEDLVFQVEQLTVILKRSSLYREMSVTSIPETINSSQSTSPDDTMSHSHAHKSLVRLKNSPVVSSQQDIWSIPCVFKCIGTLRYSTVFIL